jgi:tetratricopeptide (TPR) repeat protein
MYERYYPEPANQPTSQPANHAIRAFVEALGELGNYYTNQYIDGNRDVIAALRAEEANLRHARALARQFGWRLAMMKAMQGLYQLYGHTGRRAAWQALVEEIVPDFVDPATDGPLPGREEQWSLVTQYRVLLAIEARDWAEAERLQRAQVEWTCQRAAPALALPPDRTDDAQRNALRTLAVSLEQLGHILREQSKPECIQSYEEAIPLYQRIGDHAAEAVAAFNLGHAYKNLPTLRDLDQAEQWYRRSLDLFGPRDRLGRGKCYNGLGLVAYERFKEARESGKPEEELLRHINDAAHSTHQALALLPPDAVDDLAVAHHQLGVIYNNAGDLERALHHYNEGIRYFETAGDFYHAGQNRFNVAVALTQRGRFEEALLYACAALRNFESYEGRAAEDEQKTRELMEEIERIRREA